MDFSSVWWRFWSLLDALSGRRPARSLPPLLRELRRELREVLLGLAGQGSAAFGSDLMASAAVLEARDQGLEPRQAPEPSVFHPRAALGPALRVAMLASLPPPVKPEPHFPFALHGAELLNDLPSPVQPAAAPEEEPATWPSRREHRRVRREARLQAFLQRHSFKDLFSLGRRRYSQL